MIPGDGAAEREAIETWCGEAGEGNIPEDWSPPCQGELDHILTKDALTIRHNSLLREIKILDDKEYVLRLTLAEIEGELSPRRSEWLDAFLTAASAYWPLVHFGLTPDGRAAVAEVNFTGAPPEVLETLLQPALDSFRWIVAGLVETAEFIASPESESGVLEDLLPARLAV